MPFGLKDKELNVIFLQSTQERPNITVRKLVDIAHSEVERKAKRSINFELFWSSAIRILQNMYSRQKNWIECHIDGRPEETGNLLAIISSDRDSLLGLTITQRGRDQLVDPDENRAKNAPPRQDIQRLVDMQVFRFEGMKGLVNSARFPKLAKTTISERQLIAASIKGRRGQTKFRQDLLKVYGQCLVTGCQYEPILEAAHIEPYFLGGTFAVENGLLLRADMHTLFDLGLGSVRQPASGGKELATLSHQKAERRRSDATLRINGRAVCPH